eukprot:jgi/Mesen1/8756/ME000521S08088
MLFQYFEHQIASLPFYTLAPSPLDVQDMAGASISSVWRPWSISVPGIRGGILKVSSSPLSYMLYAIDPADAALQTKIGRRVGRAFRTRLRKKAAVSDLVEFVKDNLAEYIGRLACQPSVLFHCLNVELSGERPVYIAEHARVLDS